MKKTRLLLVLSLALMAFVRAGAAVSLAKLKVLGLTQPLGIDETPTFSWQTLSDTRGFRQSAYEITVTDADGNTVWDSGTVSSPLQSGIKYAGQPLKSHSAYTWTVRVKGEDGSESQAATSTFETAKLSPSEWTAKWIHAEKQPNAKVEITLDAPASRYPASTPPAWAIRPPPTTPATICSSPRWRCTAGSRRSATRPRPAAT